MARRLRIKWDEGKAVDALLEVPAQHGGTGVLLAHGAGAGQRHRFMVQLRRGFAAAGLVTMSFDYAYTAEGRKAPDRMPKLLAVHAAAADRLLGYVERVAFVGKSMGGRVGSHLAGDMDWPAAALVYFGYPLVPLGKGEPRNTEHLQRITAPQLFLAGTRDRLSPPHLIEPLAAGLPAAAVEVVADADHSFNVPKRSGDTIAVIEELAARVADWVLALG